MVIYKLLKYKLLDLCLELIFERIRSNFNLFGEKMIQAKNLKPGMLFKKMERIGQNRWYVNCNIRKVIYADYGGAPRLMGIVLECTHMYDDYNGYRAVKGANFPIYENDLIKIYD